MTPSLPDIGVDPSSSNTHTASKEIIVETDEITDVTITHDSIGGDSLNKILSPFNVLRNIRVSNINCLVIGRLNINSMRNKFEYL